MKTILLIIIALTLTACSSVNLKVAPGVIRTGGVLAEAEAEYRLHENFSLVSSVGMFKHYPYAGAGVKIKISKLYFGVSGVYLYEFPADKLASHGQFKDVIGYSFTESLAIEYMHFSNGSGFINTENKPNSGRDFLGFVYTKQIRWWW